MASKSNRIKENGRSPEGSSEWQSCPPGWLPGVAKQHRLQKKRAHTRLVGGTLATAAMLLILTVLAINWQSQGGAGNREPYGGLACSTVQDSKVDYLANQLSSEMVGRIERHLADCPHCRKIYRKATAELNATASRARVQAVVDSGDHPNTEELDTIPKHSSAAAAVGVLALWLDCFQLSTPAKHHVINHRWLLPPARIILSITPYTANQ